MPRLFISYRRQDSGPVSRRLAETLARLFGEDHVFMDTDSIRPGHDWQKLIHKAIREATVLLCVIGPQWLHTHNEYGQRRLDLEEDWVRDELVTAFDRDIDVLPILVSGATQLAPPSLPERLWPLLAKQFYELKDEHWQRDLGPLVERLVSLGFQRIDGEALASDVIYPPPVDRVRRLTPEELEEALKRLPEWRVVKRPQPGSKGGERTELYRTFRFTTFEDATHFMFVAARFASKHGHHPDWQNLWINVQVWLTTWDIGHRPSYKDVRLAEYLDKLYEEYGTFDDHKGDYYSARNS